MNISTIILSHYKQREKNLKRIVDDLFSGSVAPLNVIVFIDNPEIDFVYDDDRVTIIKSNRSFLPNIRFGIGSVMETDYCFFIDDDLSVNSKTLDNLVRYTGYSSGSIIGFEGSILGKTETPYSNDISVNRGNTLRNVDIVIRTYFVPVTSIMAGLQLRAMYPELPKKSLDDVFLCLGNKYINKFDNFVIPVDKDSDLIELDDGGVGQAYAEEHYKNRNEVCRFLMNKYE